MRRVGVSTAQYDNGSSCGKCIRAVVVEEEEERIGVLYGTITGVCWDCGHGHDGDMVIYHHHHHDDDDDDDDEQLRGGRGEGGGGKKVRVVEWDFIDCDRTTTTTLPPPPLAHPSLRGLLHSTLTTITTNPTTTTTTSKRPNAKISNMLEPGEVLTKDGVAKISDILINTVGQAMVLAIATSP